MAEKLRARHLGIPLEGTTGTFNTITDVAGVEVGHTTLISGEGSLIVGEGPVRTGVTAILPTGKQVSSLFAGWHSWNGNGEMTGTTWLEESGFLSGPVMITNTHSVGAVHSAVIEWIVSNPHYAGQDWSLPVVAETYDGFLNDINGFHVQKEHAFSALNNASSDIVEEGSVGGGTGMICHEFKGGIGTASRQVETSSGNYTLGVLVQANYGTRSSFTVAGVPAGREITSPTPEKGTGESGSIIVVLATDAPLLPHQLKRLSRRVPLGIGKLGGIGNNSSGDIFIAFSTANAAAERDDDIVALSMLPNNQINPLFEGTVQATEEAILNALVAAETMTGINGNTAHALPHDQLREILKKYNRLTD